MFSFWKNRIERAYQKGISEGLGRAQQQAMDERNNFLRIEMNMQIGTPLIRVPNEWENPVIGFGQRVEVIGNSPVLVIHDYVRNTETIGGGVCFDFSEQKLDILLRLNPFEAWAFLAHNSVGHHNYEKNRSGVRDNAADILKKLHDNGFFARWEEFKREQK